MKRRIVMLAGALAASAMVLGVLTGCVAQAGDEDVGEGEEALTFTPPSLNNPGGHPVAGSDVVSPVGLIIDAPPDPDPNPWKPGTLPGDTTSPSGGQQTPDQQKH
jgi:hypothetical protein